MRFQPVSLPSKPALNETKWFMNGFVREKRITTAPYQWRLWAGFPCSAQSDLL